MFEVDGVAKFYSLAGGVRGGLRGLRGTPGDLPQGGDTGGFWALDGISFTLERGETLGVIGRNGAGKSTLLGVLAGTLQPTRGRVLTSLRVASLLELGVGFHPLETGRENATAMLALHARLGRREIGARMGEIETFAGLGDRFDDPIRTYSDGMRLRLAFATVSRLEPEVLITDEVLLVGDEEFQRRCEAWFDGFLARGGSLVLCSHDLAQIGRLCERTLWLEAGRARQLGDSRAVLRAYREAMGTHAAGGEEGGGEAGVTHASGSSAGLAFEVSELRWCDEAGRDCERFVSGAAAEAVIDVTAPAGVPNVFVGITTADLVPVYGIASDMDEISPEAIGPERYRFRLSFPALRLAPGAYRVRAHALDETGTRLYDTVESRFEIEGEGGQGLAHLPFRFVPGEET